MSEYLFLGRRGHLSPLADTIARKHGACLVNYTDPGTGERRHWFAAEGRGEPFDLELASKIETALLARNLVPRPYEVLVRGYAKGTREFHTIPETVEATTAAKAEKLARRRARKTWAFSTKSSPTKKL